MLSVNKENFISSSPIYIPLTSFSCLNVLDGTSVYLELVKTSHWALFWPQKEAPSLLLLGMRSGVVFCAPFCIKLSSLLFLVSQGVYIF